MASRLHVSTPALATTISVLGAILGGALGGLMGAGAAYPIPSMIGGFCLGFATSIPFNIVLLAIAHTLSIFLNSDFDGTPIGCSSNTMLSVLMGGLGGMVSALVLVLTARHFEKFDLYILSPGCIVSILVPMVIGLVLVRRANSSWVKQT